MILEINEKVKAAAASATGATEKPEALETATNIASKLPLNGTDEEEEEVEEEEDATEKSDGVTKEEKSQDLEEPAATGASMSVNATMKPIEGKTKTEAIEDETKKETKETDTEAPVEEGEED